jgi:hypothetical protein
MQNNMTREVMTHPSYTIIDIFQTRDAFSGNPAFRFPKINTTPDDSKRLFTSLFFSIRTGDS